MLLSNVEDDSAAAKLGPHVPPTYGKSTSANATFIWAGSWQNKRGTYNIDDVATIVHVSPNERLQTRNKSEREV